MPQKVLTTASALDTLLQAAILAPSGDNTQPWHFTVDRERWTITIDVDPTRDPSPMNAGQRMAWIAVGAALENMIRTAEYNGWQYQIHRTTGGGAPQFTIEPTADPGTVDPILLARATNRRVYEGGEISPQSLARLEAATGEIEGVRANWITDRATLQRLSGLIARADALMLGTKPIRDAFLANVRFDQPANAVVDEGLSLGSLEAAPHEKFLLRLMRHIPDGLLVPLGGRKVFAQVARKLADSASGFCVVTSPEDSLESRVPVGRVWQRAWLALTEEGKACQPMMSLCVLRNIHGRNLSEGLPAIGAKATEALLRDFQAAIRDITQDQPAAIMRFGVAVPPTARVGRRPVEQDR